MFFRIDTMNLVQSQAERGIKCYRLFDENFFLKNFFFFFFEKPFFYFN